jgi:hypothetical protein
LTAVSVSKQILESHGYESASEPRSLPSRIANAIYLLVVFTEAIILSAAVFLFM